jgi:predicted ABC-type exoprotein transport system permease subunit
MTKKTPLGKFIQTIKHGAVFVIVSLFGFGLARYLEEGKTFDFGAWVIIVILAFAVLITATVRALLAARRN